MFDYAADIDSAFMDLPFMDPQYPPYGSTVIVESGGTLVFGELAMAPGPGPKGTVILVPPISGGDDLDSLIVPLTYAGIHVLQFFPRGTSREGEPYSMPKTVDDLHALLDWIVAKASPDKTAMGGVTFRLDPERVALCGLGFGGGNVSLAACAESRIAKYAIGVACGNIEAQTTAEYLDREKPRFRAMKEATRGEVDLEGWFDALTPDDKKRLSIMHQAPRLADKHLLMIGAKQDVISPISIAHGPNMNALRKAGARHLTESVLDTDHMFLTKRYALARLILTWLRTEGGF